MSGAALGEREPSVVRWRLPALLLGLTAVTTTLAQGPAYAATLLAILGAHELGHFFVAQRLGVSASLPHFIPLPPLPGFSLGTMGAVIGMQGDRAGRRALLAIGAAGPLAGFAVAIPAMVVGVRLSEVADLSALAADGAVLHFGSSIASSLLERWFGPPLDPGQDLLAHPVYIAAWAGFLVTALNLLPVGQLDGGHVAHAVWPRRSARLARWTHRALLLSGLGGLFVVGAEAVDPALALSLAWLRPWLWPGFLLWAALLQWMGVKHPPVAEEHEPLGARERILAVSCLVVLVLCFMPSPLWVSPSPASPTALR